MFNYKVRKIQSGGSEPPKRVEQRTKSKESSEEMESPAIEECADIESASMPMVSNTSPSRD